MSFVADTHAIIWQMMESSRLSHRARECFRHAEAGDAIVYISTITPIEITYLTEKGRLPPIVWSAFQKMLSGDLSSSSYQLVDVSYEIALSLENVPHKAIPDMPDRIITATAWHLKLPLITRDDKIQGWSGITTIW